MFRVLGSSGGLSGNPQKGSTCIQLNGETLIDAGTGLSSLQLSEMKAIRHIFLTHAHMDHIAALPTFVSNLFDQSRLPLKVYGLAHSLERLKQHIFNNDIWPDFTQVQDNGTSMLELVKIKPGQVIEHQGMTLTAFEVPHAIPTIGYAVQQPKVSEHSHFVFCADCIVTDALVSKLNELPPISTLMVECSFPDRLEEVAIKTQHMTPSLVSRLLEQLEKPPHSVWITHLKPSYEEELRDVLRAEPWHVL